MSGRPSANALAETLVKALAQRGMTVAAAESCTGGMVTAAITSVSGASAVLEYSAVTYANRIKEQMLGVRRETLSAYGAVSAQTACEMEKGISAAADADMGLAITGIAGPTGGTPEKPVGTVYIAVFQNGKCECERLNLLDECGEDRGAIREASVRRVLSLALKTLT